MEYFLVEESKILENKIDSNNIEFIDAIVEYMESWSDGYITEEHKDSFITKINKFFANLINSFQNFQGQIKLEVSKRMRENELDMRLHELHKQMKERKLSGATQVLVTDCWTLRDDYLACVKELKTYADKFSKMKYTRTSQIEDDMQKFNEIIKKYDDKLENGTKRKIYVPIDKMIGFVEDEISGRSKILNSLNDAISTFEQMNHDAKVLETRMDILGPSVIPKHIGFLRKIATDIAKTIKRWSVKIITTIVLIVG